MSNDLMSGYYKVAQSGGTYVVATFFNPVTSDEFTKCVRDYEYSDCSRDDDRLYDMPINTEARAAWFRSKGVIQRGDTIEVVKGRKIPIGTIGEVTDIVPICDRFGRWVADYVVLDNGKRTNVENCKLVG